MRQLKTAVLILIIFSFLLGVVYPLVMTGIAQLFFSHRANGSMIVSNGKIIGSELIGQQFLLPTYFHSRPSDCDYNAASSSSSNLGPSNPELFKQVRERINRARAENEIADSTKIPADLVLASASGLDPEISPQSALLQVARIAKSRNLSITTVQQLIEQNIQQPFIGVFGQPRVNVLTLNIALDSISGQNRH
jgi:K+-transporting ATPase ATPase C chain